MFYCFLIFHLVPSQVLKVGGRFVFVMATARDDQDRSVYEEMKTEQRWRKLLEKTRSVSSLLSRDL